VYAGTNTPVTVLGFAALAIPSSLVAAGAVMTSGTTVVLGSGNWAQIGGVVGGKALNVAADLWKAAGEAGQQRIMTDWIQRATAFGTEIVFTSNPAEAEAGSGLAFEYDLLVGMGYKAVQQGTSWVAKYVGK
jgi:hypothetical protein